MRIANVDGRAVLLTTDTLRHRRRRRERREVRPPAAVDLRRLGQLPRLGRRPGRPRPRTCTSERDQLGSPSPAPRQIVAIGLNYSAHAAESGFEAPTGLPPTFTKFVSSLAGPDCEVVLPPGGHTDWEVELVAVIGRTAKQRRRGRTPGTTSPGRGRPGHLRARLAAGRPGSAVQPGQVVPELRARRPLAGHARLVARQGRPRPRLRRRRRDRAGRPHPRPDRAGRAAGRRAVAHAHAVPRRHRLHRHAGRRRVWGVRRSASCSPARRWSAGSRASASCTRRSSRTGRRHEPAPVDQRDDGRPQRRGDHLLLRRVRPHPRRRRRLPHRGRRGAAPGPARPATAASSSSASASTTATTSARVAARLAGLGIMSDLDGDVLRAREPVSGFVARIEVAPRISQDPVAATPYNGPGRTERWGRAPGVVRESPDPAEEARPRGHRHHRPAVHDAVLHRGPRLQGERPRRGQGRVHALLGRPPQRARHGRSGELPAPHQLAGQRHRRHRPRGQPDARGQPGAPRLGTRAAPRRLELLLVPQGPGRATSPSTTPTWTASPRTSSGSPRCSTDRRACSAGGHRRRRRSSSRTTSQS